MSQTNTVAKPSFAIKTFAPIWGAAVMGTGVIAVVFAALARTGVLSEITNVLARVFAFIALFVGIVVLGITVIRWVRYPAAVAADLQHPVKGGMSATFAGGFLVLAVVTNRVGPGVVGESAATYLTITLTVIGAALALYIGFAFLTGIFARGDVQPGMITGAWFIPPVVTIIVPTALAPLLQGPGALQAETLVVLWLFLGIGSMLYLVVVATLFYRTATAKLPPANLAPSLIIGMGPAGLIGLDLILLAEAAGRVGVADAAMLSTATAAATMIWGFSLWWGIAALFVLKRGYDKLGFGLAWWGFTFPLGAFAVAGIIIGHQSASLTITVISLIATVILLALWIYVAVKTVVGVVKGTVWEA